MTLKSIEKFIFTSTEAPSVIRSDGQLEAYVSALLELDQRTDLTEVEDNFAELLSLLIEAYVQLRRSVRVGSSQDGPQEWPAKRDRWPQ